MTARAPSTPEGEGVPARGHPAGRGGQPGPLREAWRLALVVATLVLVGLLLRRIGYDIEVVPLVILSVLVTALGRLLCLLRQRRR